MKAALHACAFTYGAGASLIFFPMLPHSDAVDKGALAGAHCHLPLPRRPGGEAIVGCQK